MDLKTQVEELKKFILSSPNRFKVFSYLLSQSDNQSSQNILSGTNLGSDLDYVLDEFERKEILEYEFKDDFFVGSEIYYHFKKNTIISLLKEELSQIGPDEYLEAYFTSQDKEYQEQMMSIKKELDVLFRNINENTLEILQRICEITGYDKGIAIDEILTFISSDASSSTLNKLRGSIVHWIRTINQDVLECNLRLEEEIVPLHFYGKSINRLTNGKIEEYLLEKNLQEKEYIKKRIRQGFTTVNVRGRILGGVFFVFDFQDAKFNTPWDDKKRFFRYNYSYALQKALEDHTQKSGDQFLRAINSIAEEVLTKMKATSTIFTIVNSK